jgi:hypothetical protein
LVFDNRLNVPVVRFPLRRESCESVSSAEGEQEAARVKSEQSHMIEAARRSQG